MTLALTMPLLQEVEQHCLKLRAEKKRRQLAQKLTADGERRAMFIRARDAAEDAQMVHAWVLFPALS